MELPDALLRAARTRMDDVRGIRNVARLSGGASKQIWSFDLEVGDTELPLILRRSPPGADGESGTALTLASEAALQRLVLAAGVPVPAVEFVLNSSDELGVGYIMRRVEGESIPAKILRSDRYAGARATLAARCGEVLAAIHAVDVTTIESMSERQPAAILEQYRGIYAAFDVPHPVFELAFQWLEARLPEQVEAQLVHGDFRNGNLLVSSAGLESVLDWELAHTGDPMEDLGWICVNSWRFGGEPEVGGFGDLDDLVVAYEQASGTAVDVPRVRFWQALGTLRWGVICMMQYAAFQLGTDRSIERGMIGRRTSEAEVDLINLMEAD